MTIKTKHITAGLLLAAMSMTVSSCSDYTDIDAKGNNLLKSVSDFELLLNTEYGHIETTDLKELCGDVIYAYSPLSNSINPEVMTAKSIRWKWDEANWIKGLPELIDADDYYSGCYSHIGRIANPIIVGIDDASGNDNIRKVVKAEAYLIRAYFHYLAVQKFAPAYNKSTAEQLKAISYITEGMDITSPSVPVTLKEYYDHILSDLQNAEELDALPNRAVNKMRFSKACLYAVKALVLMSMQEYDEAAKTAEKALAINDIIDDYNQSMTTKEIEKDGQYVDHQVFARTGMQFDEDYFTFSGTTYYDCITPYAQSLIEDGHVYKYYLNTLSLGLDEDAMNEISETEISEPGYLITSDEYENWFPSYGLRSTQMYLILAEIAIHNSKFDEAMDYLDKIRINRIVPEEYTALKGVVNDKATAIKHLKMTASTEGLFSIWNFVNRKRWTQVEDFKETINRTICGINMSLTPDSKVWVFPIPQNVTSINNNFKPFLNW